jgi:hypothetical protein
MSRWPTSVWSTVPQLCLVEKGYSEDEYVIKHVDIGKSVDKGTVRHDYGLTTNNQA